jgi:hypothetical protein
MHIMIDLETMGTRPDAPIISIGAVAFDNLSVLDTFYANVDLSSAVNSGAKIDAQTVMWWLRQDAQARAAFEDGQDVAYSLVGALTPFSANWMAKHEVRAIWGNGATFDNVILRESYHRTAVPFPFPFWLDRCYRTVKSSHPDVAMERVGEHHNALDDAKSQALHLIAINQKYPYYL